MSSSKKNSTTRRGATVRPPAAPTAKTSRFPTPPKIPASIVPSPPKARRSTIPIPPSQGTPSAQPKPSVGFFGIGAMGRPMAARLIDLGFTVRVFNRTQTTLSAKPLAGATACPTAAECARGSDVLVTMVSDAAALEALLFGPDGLVAGLSPIGDSPHRNEKHSPNEKRPRPVLVDMSTIGRPAAIAIGKRVESSGARFVDAPVSGSVRPARRGELVALVGGAVRSVERARPVLEALCHKVIHAGPVGQGQALKVVLNGLSAHHLVGFTSMLALGERAGLARDVLLDAFTTGAYATPSYIGKRDKLLARDYSPDYALAMALKDFALNVGLQHECRLKLPVLRAIMSEVERGVAMGLGELDLFALEKQYTSSSS